MIVDRVEKSIELASGSSDPVKLFGFLDRNTLGIEDLRRWLRDDRSTDSDES